MAIVESTKMALCFRNRAIHEKAPVSGGFQDQSKNFAYWK